MTSRKERKEAARQEKLKIKMWISKMIIDKINSGMTTGETFVEVDKAIHARIRVSPQQAALYRTAAREYVDQFIEAAHKRREVPDV